MNLPLVGAFVLALGAMLVATVLWLASGGAWKTQTDTYIAVEVESVAGLNPDAPVKYNGVDVGKVRSIRLDPVNPQNVVLLFAIQRGTPIKEDTIAILKTQGLTGIAYVELVGGSADSPVLRAKEGAQYPQIKTSPSLSARLENVLTNVLSKIDSTTTSLSAFLSPANQAAFGRTLMNTAQVTHTLAARSDSMDSGLRDGAHALKQIDQASAHWEDLTARAARAAAALETMAVEVARTGVQTGKVVESAGADITRIGAQTLPELERTMAELRALSSALRQLTDETRRDPRGLVFGRPPAPMGPGEAGEAP